MVWCAFIKWLLEEEWVPAVILPKVQERDGEREIEGEIEREECMCITFSFMLPEPPQSKHLSIHVCMRCCSLSVYLSQSLSISLYLSQSLSLSSLPPLSTSHSPQYRNGFVASQFCSSLLTWRCVRVCACVCVCMCVSHYAAQR